MCVCAETETEIEHDYNSGLLEETRERRERQEKKRE
jgi:hypothetical protein